MEKFILENKFALNKCSICGNIPTLYYGLENFKSYIKCDTCGNKTGGLLQAQIQTLIDAWNKKNMNYKGDGNLCKWISTIEQLPEVEKRVLVNLIDYRD